MSADNGVVRIGRKGRKKFAFGEDGAPFEVDVVVAFQEWVELDEAFRDENRVIPESRTRDYHQTVQDFAAKMCGGTCADVCVAEALDFVARLREQYDEVAVFFRPRSRGEEEPSGSSESGIVFSREEENLPDSTSTS